MTIERYSEFDIDADLDKRIQQLRNACFPEHSVPRSFYKQRPHFRLLTQGDDALLAHVGLDYRMVSVAAQPLSILGIIDLCVLPSARGQGLASQLIKAVIELGRSRSIDFLMLAADDHRLYQQHGFEIVSAYCTWLRIDQFKNYGVAVEKLSDVIMVRPLSSKTWPEGPIDMLGYLF